MRSIFSIFLSCFFALISHGFNYVPTNFILGENDLSGLDIYTISQDNSYRYIIGTNNGIYRFDGLDFQKIPLENSKSLSVFNIISDKDGNQFCCNLNGQIFKINENGAELYYSLPDTLITPYISIAFDDQNNLCILNKDLIILNGQPTIETIFEFEMANYGYFFRHESTHELLFAPPFTNYYCSWQSGQLDTIYFDGENLNIDFNHAYFNFTQINNKLYVFEKLGLTLYEVNHDKLSPVELDYPNNVKNKKVFGKYNSYGNHFFRLYAENGLSIYDQFGKMKFSQQKLFPQDYFSTYYLDAEGNILLGTFGSGIYFIPNINSCFISDLPKDEKFNHIELDNEGNLFLSGNSGAVYKYLRNENEIIKNSELDSRADFLKWDTIQNCLWVSNFGLHKLQNNTYTPYKTSAVKNITPYNYENSIIATNIGVSAITFKSNGPTYSKRIYENDLLAFDFTHFNQRTFDVLYIGETEELFVASSNGLFGIKKFQNPEKIKFEKESLTFKHLYYSNGLLYAITPNEGIYLISTSSKKVVEVWSDIEEVKKLKMYKDLIIISSTKGLFIKSKNGETINSINTSDGLYNENILDFDVFNEELWVLINQGLHKINLDKLPQKEFFPILQLEQILVNNIPFTDSITELNYSENQLKFFVSIHSMKYKNELFYEYRLSGIDKDWKRSSIKNNLIEYKSLSPGSYKLEVRPYFRQKFGDIIHYEFTIDFPYYQKGWFYFLIISLLVCILLIIFKYQLNKQRKKARLINELNQTKLTALKSQMNPHFIFNSLNSIQALILNGDVNNSYNYITKFANLVRLTLENSDNEFIDFSEELKLIDLYLTLEKVRFDEDDFEFTVKHNNIEGVQIPPMLIQPFIENALIHGLLHKKGKKELSITFELKNELICTIQDNGIGRQKAKEIKTRQKNSQKSFSGNALKKRFEILKEHFGGNLGFSYLDLGKSEEPEGTVVIIKMPFKRNF
ncbi:MAG: sensor histidine kinase [Putridiphycobacter sp.]